MTDWLRSITVLAMAFVGVIVVTLGLAAVIVPSPASSAEEPGGAMPRPSTGGAVAPPSVAPTANGLGGALAVNGDREGTFVVNRESLEGNYALVGDEGRIVFTGHPVEVSQLSYDGLEFFPDPGECSLIEMRVDVPAGIGFAEVTCEQIADVRDGGTITITGQIGLPADMLVGREVPLTGGSVSVGAETWTFDFANLTLWRQPARGGTAASSMEWVDRQHGIIHFFYDVETHLTSVISIETTAGQADVPDASCTLMREELGRPNPRTVTVEMTIECPSVEVPGLGAVPIRGTVVVDETQLSL